MAFANQIRIWNEIKILLQNKCDDYYLEFNEDEQEFDGYIIAS